MIKIHPLYEKNLFHFSLQKANEYMDPPNMYKRSYKGLRQKYVERRDKTCRDTFEILGKSREGLSPLFDPRSVTIYATIYADAISLVRTRLYERLKKNVLRQREQRIVRREE